VLNSLKVTLDELLSIQPWEAPQRFLHSRLPLRMKRPVLLSFLLRCRTRLLLERTLPLLLFEGDLMKKTQCSLMERSQDFAKAPSLTGSVK
jgi:hypothetical protein